MNKHRFHEKNPQQNILQFFIHITVSGNMFSVFQTSTSKLFIGYRALVWSLPEFGYHSPLKIMCFPPISEKKSPKKIKRDSQV